MRELKYEQPFGSDFYLTTDFGAPEWLAKDIIEINCDGDYEAAPLLSNRNYAAFREKHFPSGEVRPAAVPACLSSTTSVVLFGAQKRPLRLCAVTWPWRLLRMRGGRRAKDRRPTATRPLCRLFRKVFHPLAEWLLRTKPEFQDKVDAVRREKFRPFTIGLQIRHTPACMPCMRLCALHTTPRAAAQPITGLHLHGSMHH